MANNSSVPYFKWFADESQKHDDIQFSFIAMHKEKPLMLEEMKERGCNCYWVPYDDVKRKRGMLSAIPKLYSLFKKIKPDVLHCHLFDDSFPSLIAAKLAGVKVRVITKQDTTFHWYYKPQFVKFDRFNNRIATHIHAVADENKKFILEKEAADPQKVHLIRNGFPYELMTASNEKTIQELKDHYQLHDRFVIGTVARLIKWKGHDFIIDAAEVLVKKYPQLKFIWAGTGDEGFKRELSDKIIEKGLTDHIVFTDWLERVKMPSLYKCMNLYLHPAIQEPFGFAISEALMNNVPIAATKTGSTDLIEHQKNGYVLKEKSIEDIIQAVEFYMEDEARRETIRTAGHQHALQYLTFTNMWDGHIKLYKEALAQLH